MLIKEYRIPLPLTVEEYKIAQLYMIAKKSREESSGAGSGVEILINEPYTDGPGGQGQYTRKIYHIGSHLPGWLKGILPKTALMVEEEAWNAYPYTKTRYTCPFVEKFSLEIETYYYPDNGHQENVFQLSGSDLRNRTIVPMDQAAAAISPPRKRKSKHFSVEDKERILNIYKVCVQDNPDNRRIVRILSETKCRVHCKGIRFSKRSRDSVLREKDEIIAWRRRFLREIKKYREEGKKLYFLDETWLNAGYTVTKVWKDTTILTPRQAFIEGLTTGLKDPSDVIDVVRDQLYGTDYVKEEDPAHYVSEKSGRGPLNVDWLEEYWKEVRDKQQPLPNGKALMCAYKLCRVEFRYWGMQTKIERFIHETALRKTMLRAHRQAWAWQDEWHGLTMEDIREIERQTQLALKRKMGQVEDEIDEDDNLNNSTPKEDPCKALVATLGSIEVSEDSPLLYKNTNIPTIQTAASSDADLSPEDEMLTIKKEEKWQQSRALHSPSSSSVKSFDLQMASRRIESLGRDSDTASDEEFFDCEDIIGSSSLAKWSSLDLLNEEDLDTSSPTTVDEKQDDSIFSPTFLQRVASERGNRRIVQRGNINTLDVSYPDSPSASPAHLPCNTTVLILVLHAGSVLDANVDMAAKKSDVTTFRGAFESVMRQHYPSLIGHIAIRLVSCPSICTEGLGILSSLSPYSFDVSPSCTDVPQITHDSIPIGAIPILASSTPDYVEAVSRTITTANAAYQEFIKSEEGQGFGGHVCFVADSIGSILGYDALCRTVKYGSRHGSENSILEGDFPKDDIQINESGYLTAPSPRRRSSSTSDPSGQIKLEFDVTDFFLFGSPLALILAYRKISTQDDKSNNITRPACLQVYNMFHPTDPVAARLEPLLSARFSILPPVNISRYAKYPLGNGQPYHLLEILQTNPQMFSETLQPRRMSEVSIQSTVSGVIDDILLQAISALQQKWWGGKRMDYALYCPEGLSNFPTNALPHLFHASYWESCDVIAFILRQIGGTEVTSLDGGEDREPSFRPGQPREKWIRKRTSVKLKNVTANHRANDVIVREGAPQVLMARFMYGPLDMITLTGEKVDIHVMKDVPVGEWILLATEVTDKTGRVTYTIPDDKSLGYGLYPVKMVVRGDHTSVDFFLAVVPPKTECVVFSIDGSFTASMSVTGKDPKVRAGAVDVVRHWQELGYLIIYITGRPDMQHRRVVSWLSQHNFPHGLISFADGLSTDPLGHKAAYLNNLINNHGVAIHSAYGSAKDISVYTSIALKPKQIFIVGKVSKKQQSLATVLLDGYAAHLAMLMSHGGSRPAQGNARMVIPRGYFGLPGQSFSRRRSRSAKRATSYPIATEVTQVERSLSTRRYQLPKPVLSIPTIGNHSPG